MNELEETVETLIELDEPEALLATLQRTAKRQKGERWQALADELMKAEVALNYRRQPQRATGASQPQPTGADHDKPADPAAPSPATAQAASAATPEA